MKTVGIICEYNPLHLGHIRQLRQIRERFGQETAIVCLMSGNFVQRGMPAIFDKSLRAEAALRCGADLVLELPIPYALSSAEGFAAGGVKILSGLCDGLCFGSETGEVQRLLDTAGALLSPEFPPLLRSALDTGISFPAARCAALGQMGLDASILERPNDILAVEYCKAILAQGSSLEIFPIRRGGDYHDLQADPENPSATSLRRLLLQGEDWSAFVPEQAAELFAHAEIHDLTFGERAILGRLRTMADGEFEALPYGSEGLWRKFMHACRSQQDLEAIIAETKTKRYTRSRIDRMVLCAFLGITREDLEAEAPYTRVLAFNDRGRSLLSRAKKQLPLRNAGEACDDPYWRLEQRCGDLYGLFAAHAPERPGREEKRRILYRNF